MKIQVVSTLSALSLLAIAACAPVEKDVVVHTEGGPVQCVASDWQPYVGKARTELPKAPQGLVFRVLCDTCAATMDYRSDRVSFTYDDAGVITRASCG